MDSIIFVILGKSLVLKERAIRAKNLKRDVLFISLGSCNQFGQPFELSIIYDVITAREMNCHNIQFKNAIDLNSFGRDNASFLTRVFRTLFQGTSSSETDNTQFAYETVRKGVNKEISHSKRNEILRNRNIDVNNAIEFYNSQRLKPTQKLQTKDVYDLLLFFIKANPDYDIYIDEMPVLLSRKSKLDFKY